MKYLTKCDLVSISLLNFSHNRTHKMKKKKKKALSRPWAFLSVLGNMAPWYV